MQTHDDYRRGIEGLSLTDLYNEQERWHRAIDKCPGPFVRDCVPTYQRRIEIVREAIDAKYNSIEYHR